MARTKPSTLMVTSPAGEEQTLKMKEFKRLCRENPDSLFGMLRRTQKSFKAKIADLETKLSAPHNETENADIPMAVAEEHDGTANSAATPGGFFSPLANDRTEAPCKSIVVYDPPVLKDGNNPSFPYWRFLMEMKFTANADHFDSPLCRLSYVISHTTGQAQKDLVSRMSNKVLPLIADFEDALEYLALIYDIKSTKLVAQDDFDKTNNYFGCDFEEKVQEFIRCAVDSEYTESVWKESLVTSLALGEEIQENVKELHSYANGTFREFLRDFWMYHWSEVGDGY